MRQYIFSILSPNRVFDIQGKQVRTPCEFVVDESELELYELKIKADGDTEYSIREKEAKIYRVITRDKVVISDAKTIQNDINVEKEKRKYTKKEKVSVNP